MIADRPSAGAQRTHRGNLDVALYEVDIAQVRRQEFHRGAPRPGGESPRTVARSNLHWLAEAVGGVMQPKAEARSYDTPRVDAEVANIDIGLDGTSVAALRRRLASASTASRLAPR